MPTLPVVKRCPKCEQTKDAEAFGAYKNGLQSWCKRCRIAAANASAFARRRSDKQYRQRQAANALRTRDPQRVQEQVAQDRARRKVRGTPEWARLQVQRAVYRGSLHKPSACETCGVVVSDARLLHGHHWHGDYVGRPLDVQWVCPLCHGAAHASSTGTKEAA